MTVDSHKQLLVHLSREYEALRRANADIDYQSWVISRLREATKGLNSGVQQQSLQGAPGSQHLLNSPHKASAAPRSPSPEHLVHDQERERIPAEAPAAPPPPPAQLDFSFQPQPSGEPWHMSPAHAINSSSHYLALPGGGRAGFAVSRPVAPGGLPSSKNAAYRLRQSRPGGKGSSSSYSWRGDGFPRELPEQDESTLQPGQKAHFSGKDAVRQQNSHFAAPRHHARRAGTSHCLQDATERERRLALSTALAKERVALGLHRQRQQQGEAEEAGLRGEDRGPAERRWAREAAQAEQGQVVHMAQQLLLKHDGLAAAMQTTNEQVKQQQALLQAALERLTAQPLQPMTHPSASTNAQGAPTLYHCSSSSCSVDGDGRGPTCPPLPEPVAGAWFVRAALPDVQQQPQLRQQPEGGTLLPVLRQPHTHRHKHDRQHARAHTHSKRHACRHRHELKGVLRELLEGKIRGGGPRNEGGRGFLEDASAPRRDGPGQGALQRLIRVLRGEDHAGQASVLHGVQEQQQQGQLRGLGQAAFSLQDRVHELKQQFMAARARDREQLGQGMREAEQGCVPGPAGQGGVRGVDLEDEAQQILRKDAEAFQQQDRLSKFDQLEDRLSALLQRLEQQVLQQHHHHHNPVQWGAEGGPGSAAATAAATAGGAAAPLPEAGCSGLPVRQQQQLQQPAREQELGAAELHLIMGQLQRMEEQENALRQKWLQCPRSDQHQQAALAVNDGQVHTLGLHGQGNDRDGPHTNGHGTSSTPPGNRPDIAAPGASAAGATARGVLGGASAANVGLPLQQSDQDRESDAQGFQTVGHGGAIAASAGLLSQLPGQKSSHQVPDLPSAQAAPGLADVIDDRTLESIGMGRRAFLQHQRYRDGDLVGTSDDLNPVDVVEDVADMLLDELLGQQARGLLGICDDLGEDMFEEEFSS